jgi:hypothetical protein
MVGVRLGVVMLLEELESVPLPAALTARTWNVYVVAAASPLTVAEVALAAAVTVVVVGDDITSYRRMALPEALAAGVHVTVAVDPLEVTEPMVGADGTPKMLTLLDAAESVPLPAALTARTWKV